MSPKLREQFNGVIDRASAAFSKVFLAQRGH
jgi:hypothetical protein